MLLCSLCFDLSGMVVEADSGGWFVVFANAWVRVDGGCVGEIKWAWVRVAEGGGDD